MHTEANPYATPDARIADPVATDDAQLASRWLRLGGAILDSIAVALVTLPILFFTGYFSGVMTGQEPSLTAQLGATAAGFAGFLLVHGYLLYSSGQTLAKRLLGMRIVDLANAKPVFGRLIALRYLVPQLLYIIPIVGAIIAIVGILLIFRADRRPMHDLLAGTRVIKA